MRSIAAIIAASTILTAGIAFAQEPYVVPAPEIRTNPSDDAAIWHVLGLRRGDVLNMRTAPSLRGRVIAALEEGMPVRNEGCQDRDGQYWCRVSTYGRPRISGWVNGRYISDEFVDPGQGGAYQPPPVKPGRYDQSGYVDCRFDPDPRLYNCRFGLQRQGTSALIDIETPDGMTRQLEYRAGRFKSTDGVATRSRKRGGEAEVTVGGYETYFIPDKVVLDW